jgi:hypothetical protein
LSVVIFVCVIVGFLGKWCGRYQHCYLLKCRSPKYSSSDEEDAYFKSLVDNFVTVAANTFIYTSSDDEIDYKLADQRHSVMYAEHALKHYNNDEKNEVKVGCPSFLWNKVICII